MSREPRIDEDALEKSSSADEIAGSWEETPLRALVAEADTAAEASVADVSAFVIDEDDAERSELRVVRFPRAADSAVFWFVRSARAVPAAGRFPIPRAFSSVSTSPTESLIDVPSVSRPPTRPDAPCTAPSRVPASAETPARALAAFEDRPSRAPPI